MTANGSDGLLSSGSTSSSPLTTRPLGLGLVGHGIGRSMSPGLHVILGDLTGRSVDYPVFDHDSSFTPQLSTFLNQCRAEGRIGINVTHPFKEAVCALIEPDPLVEAMGACNTVCFLPDGRIVGHNTDCTGLQQALRPLVPEGGLERVALIGTGGFGRAAAFALDALGAQEIRLFDPQPDRAVDLAGRLLAATSMRIEVATSTEQACEDATGVVNCSPVGMHHHPGNPVDPLHLDGVSWVFDAVYVPMRTQFLMAAEEQGSLAISGAELFFWQAIDAFAHFTGESLSHSVVEAARRTVWPEVERRAAEGV